ncbi:Uma2 family endonuclease [Aneurinibacillus terranovensis]|uniref:Uma2 family endonuclease n=1 Tax=Aneurinibacillus terranovensis TaxID=278991 RepID=UPI0003FFDDD6
MSSFMQHPKQKYSYQDYLNWPNKERWELIDGVPFNMSPSPSRKHQQILGELATEFTSYLRGKPCEAFVAPFDVRLFVEEKTDDEIMNVVQPDISVICDPNKLDDKGCKGSPDLVIEILSPSTGKLDRWIKYKLYERAGVKEYWIVEPTNSTIEVFILNQTGHFELNSVYGQEDTVRVGIFADLLIDLKVIFKE